MALLRYKPEQGYYTRTLSFWWFLLLAMSLGAFLWAELAAIRSEQAIYWQAGALIGIGLIALPLLYWIVNKPNVADFMIATEQEMRKVNWPSRKEIFGSTVVVIGGCLLMAAILFGFDILFATLFQEIGILKTADPA
ncbi:MAG: preprotein translocase subunit SecE [Planctomycetota bacterium]